MSKRELDSSLGSILVNIESLEAIDQELGYMREDVDNMDRSDLTTLALTMRDMEHKIVLLDDLLRYTLSDLIDNYSECQQIHEVLIDKVIKEGNEYLV